ncbi:MAG: ATP-binding protein [Bacteroidia bacterium]|nr:ATP-binding protein [Bacteroidia bacterium]
MSARMIPRELEPVLRSSLRGFPVVLLTGPRQSGKTTLVRHTFPELPYCSLEDPDLLLRAEADPRGFLGGLPQGAVIDEAQRMPALFSYIQGIVDRNPDTRFILSGSQNFLLMERITQSLAGRAAVLRLMPLSLSELWRSGRSSERYESYLFKGLYPALYVKPVGIAEYYRAYLETYVQRDVRQLRQIQDLSAFTRFIALCAGRTGQLLNLQALATDAGVSVHTAKSWLSVLEASYIVFLLEPYHANFSKRLVKMPKLYFWDTGLAAALLRIESEPQLDTHYLRGGLFENLIIAEWIKRRLHQGRQPAAYFWRDSSGHEIDLLIERAESLFPVEIKSGQTFAADFVKGLQYFGRTAGSKAAPGRLIYGGDSNFSFLQTDIRSWKDPDACSDA